jgi:LPXTG-motif cell wall-anchored protein
VEVGRGSARRPLSLLLSAALLLPGALALVTVAATTADAALDTTMYGIASDQRIYGFNETTGVATPISAALSFGSAAIARQPGTGLLYVYQQTASANQYRVAAYDTINNTTTIISTTFPSSLLRLAFRSDGQLYGGVNNVLYHLDPATGAILSTTTLTGVPNGGGDLTFGADNTMYLVENSTLWTFAPFTAVPPATLAPATTVTMSRTNAHVGLAFGQSGALYAIDSPSSGNSTLSTINLATGAETALPASATRFLDLTTTPNRPPTTGSTVGPLTTPRDTPVTATVTTGASDPDGDPVTLLSAQGAVNGIVTINAAAGTVTFTPSHGYSGAASYTYTLSDGNGGTVTRTVNVTVGPDQAPTAVADSFSIAQDAAAATVSVLANDTDPEGDPLTVTSVGAAAHGTVTVIAGGTGVTYKPTAGYSGPDSFTYTISDGYGGTATGTVSVTVTRTNRPPTYDAVASNTSQSIPAGGSLAALRATDPDAGDTLRFTVASGTLPAGITLNADGTFSGRATGGGSTTVVITVSDGKGGTASTTLVVTVANGPPNAVADSASTPMGTPVTLSPLSNDTDPNGDALSLVSAANGADGTVSVTGSVVTYTPGPGFFGTDSFTYVVTDPQGARATGTVTVNVTFVNSPPVYTLTTNNTSQTIDPQTAPAAVTATDANGDPLTYALTGGTLPPGVSLNPDGSFGGLSTTAGSYPVTIRVSDGQGGTATTSLTIFVRNAPPAASDDTDTTLSNTPVTTPVRFNDRDANGDPLVVASVTQGTSGSVAIDATSGNPTYTPDPAFVGTDTYTYTVSDGRGGTATATVTVTVGNAAPVFTAATTNRSQTVSPGSVPVALAATDANRDTLTYTRRSGSLPPGLTLGGNGSFGGLATTSGTYTSVIEVADGRGGTDTTTLVLVVPNVAPVAVADRASTAAATPVRTDVRGNDTDANGDALTITGVTQGANGTVTQDPTTGNPTYTPRAGFAGTDTYTYTVDDGHGATATGTVTVTVANAAPAFTSSTDNTAQNVRPGFTPARVNATDPNGDPLTYALVSGTLPGSVVLAGDGTFSGIVTTAGSYTVRISADDGRGGIATTTLVLTVDNAPPTAVADSVTVPYAGTISTDVRFNDTDPNGDTLVVTGFTQGADGVVSAGPGGTVSYAPRAGFSGADTYTYTVSDGHGGTATGTVTVTVGNGSPTYTGAATNRAQTVQPGSTPARLLATDPNGDPLTFTVTSGTLPGGVALSPAGDFTGSPSAAGTFTVDVAVNDGKGGTDTTRLVLTVPDLAPTAVDDSASTAYLTAVTVPVLDNDTDPNGDRLTVAAATNGTNGTVTINAGRDVTYTPRTGFSGVDTFTYTASDGTNPPVRATVTVSVANAPPAFTGAGTNSAQTVQPGATPIRLQANDPNGDALVYGLASGTLPAGMSLGSDGVFTGTARAAGTFIVTVSVTDLRGTPVAHTLTLTVLNLPPAAVADSGSTAYGVPATTDVLANDTDPNGDRLTVSATTDGANGTVTLDGAGRPVYTGAPGFSGVDTYTYTVTDGTSYVVGTVTVTVGNGAPTFTAAPTNTAQTVEPTATPVALAATDPNGDPLSYAVSAGALPVGVTLTPAGTFTGSPSTAGTYTATVTVDDGKGGSDRTTLVITVPNRAPTANADTASTPYLTPVTTAVRFNDRDPNGDFLTVQATTAGTHGAVALNGSGDPVYTPEAGFSGVDTYGYTVQDPGGLRSSSTVTVTVGNGAPTYTGAMSNSAQTVQPGGAPSPLLATDPNAGDRLTFAVSSGTLPPGISLNPDGSFGGTASTAGLWTVTVRVSDGKGGSDVTSLQVTVANVGPTAVDDSASTASATAVSTDVLANDTDPNGDTLTVLSVTQGGHGTVTLVGGRPTYTPDTGYAGFDSYGYTVEDPGHLTSSATVTVAVGNAPPTFTPAGTNRSQTVQPGAVPVPLAATDPNNDPLSYRLLSGTLPTRMSLRPDGSFTGPAKAAGSFTVTAEVADGNGGTDTVVLTLVVPNVAPVAADDAYATPASAPVTTPVRGNDSDPNGDAMTVTLGRAPTGGTVTINPVSGDPVYTPRLGFTGDDTFTYTVADPAGLVSNLATVTISVANAPPAFTGSADNTGQTVAPGGGPARLTATDPNPGDTLTYTVTSGALPGGVTLNADGTFAGATSPAGSFTATITVDDGHLGTDTTTLVIDVPDVAPIALDDAATTTYDTAVTTDVLGNDTDANGDALVVVAVGAAPSGTTVFTARDVTYTPGPGFSGTDAFTYTVTDPGGHRATATVRVTVGNAPPVFTSAASNSSQALRPGDTPTAVQAVDPNVGDTVTYSTADPLPAGVSLNADGTFTGTVRAAGTFSVTVTATDGKPGGSTSHALVLTVLQVGPVAVDDGAGTPYLAAVDVDVLANDSDPNGDPLTVTGAGPAANGAVTFTPTGVTYTPRSGFSGTDTFSYSVSDGVTTAAASVTVTVGNAPPAFTAAPTNQRQVVEPGATPVPVTATDPNGDPLTYTLVGGALPAGMVLAADGSFSGPARAAGDFPVTVAVTDGNGGRDTTALVLTVPNRAPVAVADTASTATDTPVSTAVTANDSDPNGDGLSVTGVTAPAHGTVTFSGGSTTYTPATGYAGPDSFDYTVGDTGSPSLPATATVSVDVGNAPPVFTAAATNRTQDVAPGSSPVAVVATDPNSDPLTYTLTRGTLPPGVTLNGDGSFTGTVAKAGTYTATIAVSDGKGGTATTALTLTVPNVAPIANDDLTVTPYRTAVTTDVLANDTDPNGDTLSISGLGVPGHGTVGLTAGRVTYTPFTGFSGPDSYTYTVSDGRATAQGTVRVTVGNGPPAFTTAPENTVQAVPTGGSPVPVVATDPENDPLTYALVSGALPAGISLSADGSFTGVTSAKGSYPVRLSVSDGSGQDRTDLTITVQNGPPVFSAASTNRAQDVAPGATPAALVATDPNGDAVLYAVTAGALPTGVTLRADGTFAGATVAAGTCTVTVTVADSSGATDTTTLVLTVGNAPPAYTSDPANTAQTVGRGATPTSLAATDPNGDPLTYAVTRGTPPPGITLNADGTWNGTPSAPGTTTFDITVSDGALTDVTSLTITVPGSPPVLPAGPDIDQTVPAGATPANLSATVFGGGVATFTVSGGALPPGIVLNPDGTFTGLAGPVGVWRADLTVTGGGGSTAGSVTIHVLNEPPAFTASPANTAQTVATGDRFASLAAIDANGDPLTYALTSGSLPPGVVLNPDGSFGGTATTAGDWPVTVTVTDVHAASTSSALVLSVPSAPSPSATPSATPSPTPSATPSGLPVITVLPASPSASASPSPTPSSSPAVSISPAPLPAAAPTLGPVPTVPPMSPVIPSTSPTLAPASSLTQTRSTGVDQPLAVDLTGRSGAPSGLHLIGGPTHGSVTLRPDGTALYVPALGYSGVDAFTYAFTGGGGAPVTGTVHIRVGAALPRTGAETAQQVTAGLGLLLVGFLLALIGRRRPREDERAELV